MTAITPTRIQCLTLKPKIGFLAPWQSITDMQQWVQGIRYDDTPFALPMGSINGSVIADLVLELRCQAIGRTSTFH